MAATIGRAAETCAHVSTAGYLIRRASDTLLILKFIRLLVQVVFPALFWIGKGPPADWVSGVLDSEGTKQ